MRIAHRCAPLSTAPQRVSVSEVERILARLLLDGVIDGKIDQVTGVLDTTLGTDGAAGDGDAAAAKKFAALHRWAGAVADVNGSMLQPSW